VVKLIIEILLTGLIIMIVLGFAIKVITIAVRIVLIAAAPFLFVSFVGLSIVSYPLTLFLRYKGIPCRSFFVAVGSFFFPEQFPEYEEPSQNHREQSQSSQSQSKKAEPPPEKKKPSPWDILGVPPGSSKEKIVSAYRNKLMTNHPDKLADLDPELQSIANERVIQINDAYKELIAA
jgi:hypothetical protein